MPHNEWRQRQVVSSRLRLHRPGRIPLPYRRLAISRGVPSIWARTVRASSRVKTSGRRALGALDVLNGGEVKVEHVAIEEAV
jgi:hypothetical protein